MGSTSESLRNDGEGLGALQNPLLRMPHPLAHSNGHVQLVQQVPAWLETPENVTRVRKTLLEALGCE